MTISKLSRGAVIAFAVALTAAASYMIGTYAQRKATNQELANTQAMLAFGHYKFYERIESLLMQKCYEAASTDARELKNLQLHLVAETLRAGGTDPDLVEYIKVRDPKALEQVLAGRVPERKTYTTTCS